MKRTGLSVTDPLQIIVQGLDTQETVSVLEFIKVYASKEPVDAIVVGYPFLDGEWGDKKFKVKLDDFLLQLKNYFLIKWFTFMMNVIHLFGQERSFLRAVTRRRKGKARNTWIKQVPLSFYKNT